MAKTLKVVQRNKADKLYRFVNFTVDVIFSVFLIWSFYIIYLLLKSSFFITEINPALTEEEHSNHVLDGLYLLLLYAFVLFLTELATGGRSLGKFITGTKVVKNDGSTLTLKDLLLRNFSRVIPLEQVTFIGNLGWHDEFSNTTVVKVDNFEKEKTSKLLWKV